MKLLLFFCFFYSFALSENRNEPIYKVFSQEQSESSIKKTADSLFNQIKPQIKEGNFAEAEAIAEKSLQLYERIGDESGIGNCLNKIATISYYVSDFPKALVFYDRSIVVYKEIGFQKGIASSLNNEGAIYYYLGNYPEALDHYKRAIAINESLGNEKQKATGLRNIGGIYFELDEFTQAMVYFETARKTYEALDDEKSLAQVLNAIGETYLAEGAYKLALKHIEQGLFVARKVGAKQDILAATYTMAKLKNASHEYLEALELYKAALEQADRLSNQHYKAMSLIARGELYFELNNQQASVSSCTRGLQLAEQLNLVAVQKDACSCLYKGSKSLNNTEKALAFYERSIRLTDSLQTRKTVNKVLHMEFEREQLLDSIIQVEKERRRTQNHQIAIEKREEQRNILIIGACFILVIAVALWSRLRFIKKSKSKLQIAKDRSEHLLLNILPEEIAEELKAKGYVDAQDFDTATILFTDFKSFTETASKLTPQELVEEINVCFKAFDAIMETYDIEKIKTIGDAYMAAGGLPQPDIHAVKNTILAALDMQTFISNRKQENTLLNKPAFEMRVGLHVGPIVAGIVGIKKFQYDIWGDTVNTASRMESNGEVGKVNISEDTYTLVKEEPDLVFEYRGKINAKGKGELAMYFVEKTAF